MDHQSPRRSGARRRAAVNDTRTSESHRLARDIRGHLLSGLYATYLRIVYGLGGSTNLSDKFPWGIWIAFDVMCGVGLAAGGFTLVAMVHIFNIERISRCCGRPS